MCQKCRDKGRIRNRIEHGIPLSQPKRGWTPTRVRNKAQAMHVLDIIAKCPVKDAREKLSGYTVPALLYLMDVAYKMLEKDSDAYTRVRAALRSKL